MVELVESNVVRDLARLEEIASKYKRRSEVRVIRELYRAAQDDVPTLVRSLTRADVVGGSGSLIDLAWLPDPPMSEERIAAAEEFDATLLRVIEYGVAHGMRLAWSDLDTIRSLLTR